MRRIWKFPITPNSIEDHQYEFEIKMPYGSKLLHVGLDGQGVPAVWAEVFTDRRSVLRRFLSVGTGHGSPPDSAPFVGTIVLSDGYVFHIYDGGEL